MQAPRVRFAQSEDVQVAYQVIGEGNPVDIVYVAGFVTHLGVNWELPAYRRFCERLASFARVIHFDKRGMGMSDRVQAGTLEERMDDVRAVMDAVGSERAFLIGESEGGPLSMLFAAAHPERTLGLVLAGAEVKERTTDDWPWGENTKEGFETSMSRIDEVWGNVGGSMARMAPSLADDPYAAEWLNRLVVNAATPNSAKAFMRMAFDIDVRNVAPTVQVPTLVLHRVDDAVCHVENARFLARSIEGSRYEELPGADHVPWSGGDDMLDEIRKFVTGVREEIDPDRVLATVMFTDIVSSTQLASRSGDTTWRGIIEDHDETIRGLLRHFRGVEVKTTGDGILATFDRPARAIRCARSIHDSMRQLDLEVRTGIHTGEIELRRDDITGIAVVIGQRICSLAGAGETLVSRTVVDLVAGSGIEFVERSEHELKGVPGTWSIFQVAE